MKVILSCNKICYNKATLASANIGVADTMANNDSVKSADNKLKQNLQDSINVNKNTIEKSEREGNVPTKPSSAAVERADLKNAATAVRTGAYSYCGHRQSGYGKERRDFEQNFKVLSW